MSSGDSAEGSGGLDKDLLAVELLCLGDCLGIGGEMDLGGGGLEFDLVKMMQFRLKPETLLRQI